MRIHRFYTDQVELDHKIWLHDERLLLQWQKVLRFAPGQEVVLFDGQRQERLYRITQFENKAVHLESVTDFARKLPTRDVYLLWALLKNDHNDMILEKCTELGVRHFIPMIAERCVKNGFNIDRARRIVIEASEQCGRSDIPLVHEPMSLQEAISTHYQHVPLLVGHQDGQAAPAPEGAIGVCIGPEGGWSAAEEALFKEHNLPRLGLSRFTLRAETAAITAAAALAGGLT